MSSYRFGVTYKGTAREVTVSSAVSSSSIFSRLCKEIDQVFHFSAGLTYLVYQSSKDKVDTHVGIRSSSNSTLEVTLNWHKNSNGFVPLRLVSVNEEEEDAFPRIDVKFGVHPLYHLVQFEKAFPPTLDDVFAAVAKSGLAAASCDNGSLPREVHYRDVTGRG